MEGSPVLFAEFDTFIPFSLARVLQLGAESARLFCFRRWFSGEISTFVQLDEDEIGVFAVEE